MGDMTLRIARIAAALPLIALLLGCGAAPSPVTQEGQGAAAPCPPQPMNEAGLTSEQRTALYDRARAEGWRCYGVWVASLSPATIPYETLGHTGMQVLYGPPEGKSLSEAKAKADVIVSGTIVSLSPLSTTFGTAVTVAVSQVLKGQAGKTIALTQASHLEPTDNWKSILIVDAYNAPLLLPGESVFLFLKSLSQGGFAQLIVTGTYYVRNGRIQALELNPFALKVNGQLPTDFIAAVAAA